MTSLPPDN